MVHPQNFLVPDPNVNASLLNVDHSSYRKHRTEEHSNEIDSGRGDNDEENSYHDEHVENEDEHDIHGNMISESVSHHTAHGINRQAQPFSKALTKARRNKWREEEDTSLMMSTLSCRHLLVNVEYYKPMKNFWIKVSTYMRHHYQHVRNHRQCHDRFLVLYSKGCKMLESPGFVPNYKMETLLLEITQVFKLSKGIVVLTENIQLSEMHHSLGDTTSCDGADGNENAVHTSRMVSHNPVDIDPSESNTVSTSEHVPPNAGIGMDISKFLNPYFISESLTNLQDQISSLRQELEIHKNMLISNQKRTEDFYSQFMLLNSNPMQVFRQQQLSNPLPPANPHQNSPVRLVQDSSDNQYRQTHLNSSRQQLVQDTQNSAPEGSDYRNHPQHHHHHNFHRKRPQQNATQQQIQEPFPLSYEIPHHYHGKE